MEIKELFKDKNREEGVGITDFISKIVQILKQDLRQLKINTQDTELIKSIKL